MSRKEFVTTLNVVAVRSHNLILEVQSNSMSSSIIHQKNNILYLLSIAERLATKYEDNPIADIKKLCSISTLLRNLLNDITERKANYCKEMLKDLLSLLQKAKKIIRGAK